VTGGVPYAERKQLSKEITSQVGRLTRRLVMRDLPVNAGDVDTLKRAVRRGPDDLARLAAVAASPELDEFLGTVRRVRDRLEEEHRSRLGAKRLFEGEREEAPPRYRRLVADYFRVLSEVELTGELYESGK
jgi:hypothetical protein